MLYYNNYVSFVLLLLIWLKCVVIVIYDELKYSSVRAVIELCKETNELGSIIKFSFSLYIKLYLLVH